MKFVIVGSSITSSWGNNGHAATYRGLMHELSEKGHQVLFLERDTPNNNQHRDFPHSAHGEIRLYESLEDLQDTSGTAVRNADIVILGSNVPEGVRVAEWVLRQAKGMRIFYDMDTPVTLKMLEGGNYAYLKPDLIPRFDLYLSITGGDVLSQLEYKYGASHAKPLYGSVDANVFFPLYSTHRWDLGYMGTYSSDRQSVLQTLMLDAAQQWIQGRFVLAGPSYPQDVELPTNVLRIEHVPQQDHPRFYNAQRWTLSILRDDMKKAGFSPSTRMFEAAACGTPIISDYWEGIETIFTPGEEILISTSVQDTLNFLQYLHEEDRERIAGNARRRVLNQHTAKHRVETLERYIAEASLVRV